MGELQLGPGEVAEPAHEGLGELQPGGFYHTLKSRVDEYFREHKARAR